MSLSTSGSYKKTQAFLANLTNKSLFSDLDRYGKMGVDALSKATPFESGETARSWGYNVINTKGSAGIEWYNSHEQSGANIAILLQYGHGTGTGGYVAGRDYINPAIRPIFDQIANDVWKRVNHG